MPNPTDKLPTIDEFLNTPDEGNNISTQPKPVDKLPTIDEYLDSTPSKYSQETIPGQSQVKRTEAQLQSYKNLGIPLNEDQADTWDEQRAQKQSGLDRVANATVNLVGKTGAYLLQTVGLVGGAPFALTGDISNMTDNIVDRWADAAKTGLEEAFPIYAGKQYTNGDIWDKLGTSTWYESDAIDRIALSIATLAPGMLAAKGISLSALATSGLKGLSAEEALELGNSIKTLTSSLKSSRIDSFTAKMLEGGSDAFQAIAKNSTKAEMIVQNLIAQSGLGARETQTAITKDLTEARDRGENDFSDEEISKKGADGAKSTFWQNAPVAFMASIIEIPQLFKQFSEDKKLFTKAFDDLGNPVKVLEKTGLQKGLYTGAKMAGTALEHGQSENLQVAIGRYNEDLQEGKTTDEATTGILKRFISDFSDPNGQNNIALGTIQGLLTSALGSYGHARRIAKGEEKSEATQIKQLQGFVEQSKLWFRNNNSDFVKRDPVTKETIIDPTTNQPIQDTEKITRTILGMYGALMNSDTKTMDIADNKELLAAWADHNVISSQAYDYLNKNGGKEFFSKLLTVEKNEKLNDKNAQISKDQNGFEITPERQLQGHLETLDKLDKLNKLIQKHTFSSIEGIETNKDKQTAGDLTSDIKRSLFNAASTQIFLSKQKQKNLEEIADLSIGINEAIPANQKRVETLHEENKNIDNLFADYTKKYTALIDSKNVQKLYDEQKKTNAIVTPEATNDKTSKDTSVNTTDVNEVQAKGDPFAVGAKVQLRGEGEDKEVESYDPEHKIVQLKNDPTPYHTNDFYIPSTLKNEGKNTLNNTNPFQPYTGERKDGSGIHPVGTIAKISALLSKFTPKEAGDKIRVILTRKVSAEGNKKRGNKNFLGANPKETILTLLPNTTLDVIYEIQDDEGNWTDMGHGQHSDAYGTVDEKGHTKPFEFNQNNAKQLKNLANIRVDGSQSETRELTDNDVNEILDNHKTLREINSIFQKIYDENGDTHLSIKELHEQGIKVDIKRGMFDLVDKDVDKPSLTNVPKALIDGVYHIFDTLGATNIDQMIKVGDLSTVAKGRELLAKLVNPQKFLDSTPARYVSLALDNQGNPVLIPLDTPLFTSAELTPLIKDILLKPTYNTTEKNKLNDKISDLIHIISPKGTRLELKIDTDKSDKVSKLQIVSSIDGVKTYFDIPLAHNTSIESIAKNAKEAGLLYIHPESFRQSIPNTPETRQLKGEELANKFVSNVSKDVFKSSKIDVSIDNAIKKSKPSFAKKATKIKVDPEWRTFDHGFLEGQLTDKEYQEKIKYYEENGDAIPENGTESFDDFGNRIEKQYFKTLLSAPNGTSIFVSSQVLKYIKSIVGATFNYKKYETTKVTPAEIYKVTEEDGRVITFIEHGQVTEGTTNNKFPDEDRPKDTSLTTTGVKQIQNVAKEVVIDPAKVTTGPLIRNVQSGEIATQEKLTDKQIQDKITKLESELNDPNLPIEQLLEKGEELANLTDQLTQGKSIINENDQVREDNSEENFDDIEVNKLSQTKAKVLIDIPEALEWLNRNLPHAKIVTFEDVNTILKNLETKGLTWGFFQNKVIYLSTQAEKGTEYHEAFHYVFRTLLTDAEINRLYKVAINRYGLPSKEQLRTLKESSRGNKTLTSKGLINLWLEEKMADQHQSYQHKQTNLKALGLIGKLIDKINQFYNWITNNKTELEAFFGKINSGGFINSDTHVTNMFNKDSDPVFKLIPNGKTLEGVNAKYTYLPSEKGKTLINTIAGIVSQRLQGKSNESLTSIINDVMSEKHNFESLDNNKALLASSTDKIGLIKQLQANRFVFINEDSTRIIRDQVSKLIAKFEYSPIEEELEDKLNEEENERGTFYNVNAINIGGFGSLNTEVRAYIGTTMYNVTDELGRPTQIAVNAQVVYQGLERVLSNTHPENMMGKLKHFVEDNIQSKAVYDRIVADTGYDVSSGVAQKNPQLLQQFLNSFTKEKLNYLQILVDLASGKYNVINANTKDAKKMQFSQWFRNYTQKTNVFFEATVTKLKQASQQLHSLEGIKSIKEALNSVGIEVSDKYIKFSILKNIDPTNELVTYNTDLKPIEESDLNEIANSLSKKQSPFEETEGDELSGNIGRIEKIAESNSYFDENVISSNFQDAEGKTRWSFIQGSLGMERTRELGKQLQSKEGREAFKQSLKEQLHNFSFNTDNFLLNHEFADELFAKFEIEFTGDLRQNEPGKEGCTFKHIGTREFKLMQYGLFSNVKKRGDLAVARFYPKVLEASVSAYSVQLPVEQFYKGKQATSKGIETLYKQFLQEIQRISECQKEIENKDIQKIKGYHTADKNGNIRGLNLFYFKYLQKEKFGPTLLEKAKTYQTKEDLKELEQSIKDAIKTSVEQEVANEIKDLQNLGIINEKVEGETSMLPVDLRENAHEKIGNFYMNNLINLNAYNDLIEMNPNFSKDATDNIKRAKRWIAAKVNYGKGNHVVGFREEPTAQGKTKVIDIADAQAEIDINHHKFMLMREGKLNEEVNKILDKIDDGEKLTWEEIQLLQDKGALLNNRKTVTAGPVDYHKMSDKILTKNLTSYKDKNGVWQPRVGRELLHEIRTQLENLSKQATLEAFPDFKWGDKLTIAQLDQLVPARILPPSGSKLLTPVPSKLIDGKYTFDKSNTRLVENKYSGKQVETPSGKTEITDGTQLIQLIDSEQNDNEVVNYQGKDVKIEELRQIYQDLLSQARTNSVDSAKKYLGKIVNGELTEKNETKFRKKLLDALETSGADDNLLQFFGLDPSYNLNLPPTLNKYEQLFLAHFSKKVLSQKSAGLKLTLASGDGYNVLEKEDGTLITSDLYHSLDPKDRPKVTSRELKYNPTGLSEVALPAFTRELHNLKVDDSLPEEVLKMFGIRIPTEDKHSMLAFKVVEFLPSEYGSISICPKEVVELSGADFDIDSLFATRKDYYMKNDKFIPFGTATTTEGKWEEYQKDIMQNNKDAKKMIKTGLSIFEALNELQLPDTLEEFTKQTKDGTNLSNASIKNAILDAQILFLTNKKMTTPDKDTGLSIAETPSSTKNLGDARDKILKLQNKEKSGDFQLNSSTGQFNSWKNNSTGSENIGPVALMSMVRSFLYKAKIHLQTDAFRPRINGKSLFDFGNNKDSQKNRIQDNIGTELSAMTDNAKDPMSADLNLNMSTLGPVTQLTSLGVDIYDAMLIINQPIVKEYTDALEQLNSVINTPEEEFASKKKIRIEFEKKLTPVNNLDCVTKELEDNIKINNKSTDSKVLQTFFGLEDSQPHYQALSTLLALNKGLPTSFKDTQKITKALETLKLNPGDKVNAKAPFDVTHALIGTHVANNIDLFHSIMKISKEFVITQSNTFQKTTDEIEGNIKQFIKDKSTVLNKIKLNLLAFLSINKYKGNNDLKQSLLSGPNSIVNQYNDVIKENPQLKTNKLIRFLEKSKVTQFKSFQILTGNTRIKFAGDMLEQITEGFTELYNDNKTKEFAKNLFDYLIIKDNLQFKNNSFLKFIAPFMFTKMSDVMNKMVDDIDQTTSREQLNNFKDIWFRHIENQDYITTIKANKKVTIEDTKEGINVSAEEGANYPLFIKVKNDLYKLIDDPELIEKTAHYAKSSIIGNIIQSPYGFSTSEEVQTANTSEFTPVSDPNDFEEPSFEDYYDQPKANIQDNSEELRDYLKKSDAITQDHGDLFIKQHRFAEAMNLIGPLNKETPGLIGYPKVANKLGGKGQFIYKIIINPQLNINFNKATLKTNDLAKSNTLEKYTQNKSNPISTDILKTIIENNKGEWGSLAKKLLSIISKNSTLTVEVADKFNKEYLISKGFRKEQLTNLSSAAFWSPKQNKIYLSKEIIESHNENNFIRNFLHEMMHSFTNFPFYKKESELTEEDRTFLKEINNLYNKSKELSSNKDMYGFTDPQEFISEITTNPKFVAEMKSLSTWEKIKNSIFKFLTGKSLYDTTKDIIEKYLDNLDKVEPFSNLEVENRANIEDKTEREEPNLPESAFEKQQIFYKRQLTQLKKQQNQYTKGTNDYLKIQSEIDKIAEIFDRAQIEENRDLYTQLGLQTLDALDKDIITNIENKTLIPSPKDIEHAVQVIEAFTGFRNLSDKTLALGERLFKYVNENIEKQVAEFSTEDKKPSIEDINNQNKDINTLKKGVGALADSPNYIVRTIGMVIGKGKNTVETKNKELVHRIQPHVNAVHNWAKSQGIASKDTYNVFLQKNKGTYILTKAFNEEFYAGLFGAFTSLGSMNGVEKQAGKDWLVKNAFRDDEGEWKAKDTKYSNPNWNIIQSTPELKAFYDFYQKEILNMQKFLPVKLGKDFIPNVKQDNFGSIVKKLFPVKYDEDGRFVGSEELEADILPNAYTKRLSIDEKSKDLGRSLLIFGQYANNHDQMTKILPNLRLLQEGLKNKFNKDGNITTRKFIKSSDPTKSVSGEESNLYKQAETVIEMQVLGKMKSQQGRIDIGDMTDEEGNVVGKKYVLLSDIADILLKFNSILRIGFSPITAISNIIFGDISNIIEAFGGRYFTFKGLYQASGIFFKQNFDKESFMYDFLTKVNPLQELDDYEHVSDVSLKTKSLNPEKLQQLMYGMQKGGEKYLQTRSALAIAIKDGYCDSNGVPTEKWTNATQKEIDALSNKIQSVNQMMHGRYSQKEAAAWQQNIGYRLCSQFKKWIPAYLESRLNEYQWDNRKQAYTEGRYRTFYTLVRNLSDTVKRLKEGKLTELETYNMRKNLIEMCILGCTIFAFAALHGGNDDDAKKKRRNPSVKLGLTLLNRASGDLEAFYDPTSVVHMVANPISLMVTAQTMLQAFKYIPSAFTDHSNYKTGSRKGRNKELATLERLTPGAKLIDEGSRIMSDARLEELDQ